MSFDNLKLSQPVLRALREEGYTSPSPIQSQAIPPVLLGHDLLGCAQTGTGKTAAFAVPILEALTFAQRSTPSRREIKALILAPTRELAIQIGESFDTYGKYLHLKTAVIFGGVSQHPQTKALTAGIDILVATPGRLLDLMGQRLVSLSRVSHFVLDEADRMLDMGMLRDVRRIIAALPTERQTLFFSATMPPEIEELANTILRNPVKIEITPAASTVDTIRQSVYFVNKSNKANLLTHILTTNEVDSALVFSRTKHGADKIVKSLQKDGIDALAIHGNKSQNARQLALGNFKSRKTRILVATDIAARGIDIDELSHVIIYDLPEVPETYVHRIGRTGRAGLGGTAISFCDKEEKLLLRDIQKLTRQSVPVVEDHPYPLDETIDESTKKAEAEARRLRSQGRGMNSQRNSEPRKSASVRKEPQSRQEQPSRKAAPSQDTFSARKAAPSRDSFPARKNSPAPDTSAARRDFPARKDSPRQSSPINNPSSAQKSPASFGSANTRRPDRQRRDDRRDAQRPSDPLKNTNSRFF